MPEDRTPIDHGLAHPQPERGRIPQPKPQAGDDPRELVPNQDTFDDKLEKDRPEDRKQPGVGGRTDVTRQPD